MTEAALGATQAPTSGEGKLTKLRKRAAAVDRAAADQLTDAERFKLRLDMPLRPSERTR